MNRCTDAALAPQLNARRSRNSSFHEVVVGRERPSIWATTLYVPSAYVSSGSPMTNRFFAVLIEPMTIALARSYAEVAAKIRRGEAGGCPKLAQPQ